MTTSTWEGPTNLWSAEGGTVPGSIDTSNMEGLIATPNIEQGLFDELVERLRTIQELEK
jgi:hypothetical protein